MIDLGTPKLIAQLLVRQRELELRDIGNLDIIYSKIDIDKSI